LEVFADTPDEMERQARDIGTWADNVFVKIPITNTAGVSMLPLVARLASRGVRLNVTALMTLRQVGDTSDALRDGPHSFVSVFAGRIADTGRDPLPMMAEAVGLLGATPNAELLWASPREVLNVFQADSIGCHVITATNDILKKLAIVGKDLDRYSLETVQMFRNDAVAAGYKL
jgi:transaldolase